MGAEAWAAVAHIVNERKAQGKESEVYYRGEMIPWEKVRKGIKRYRAKGHALTKGTGLKSLSPESSGPYHPIKVPSQMSM